MDNNLVAFFSLIKAGLWEKEVQLSTKEPIDYNEVFRLAEEQSVVGLLAAGIECIKNIKVPQEIALTVAGEALQLEQRNQAMNDFIAQLSAKLLNEGIVTLLVKGQGIAQCYGHPLWRASGDVDLLVSVEDYDKAKKIIIPYSNSVEPEGEYSYHLGMNIRNWMVELHGSLRTGLGKRVDRLIDEVYAQTFRNKKFREWQYREKTVLLPAIDDDIIFVFTHILQHFYKGGVGLRQVCDWCRLIWMYQSDLNFDVLEYRLRKMDLMTEWKSFASVAVNILGMPQNAMPFYSNKDKWSKKADRISQYMIKVGNFGHNIENKRDSKFVIERKVFSATSIIRNTMRHFTLFPLNTIRISCFEIGLGVKATLGMKR